MNDPKKFIQNLELSQGDSSLNFPPIFLKSREGLEDLEEMEGEVGILNFKSLCSFVSGVSIERQEDVLNSLLLAQRAATKAFPNYDQIIEWYRKYFEVLGNIGWVFENKDFSEFKIESSLFQIENALLGILGSALTGNQLAILLKTIDALKTLGEDDKRFVAFEKHSHSLKKASFQLGVAMEKDNIITISTSAFILNSDKDIKKILFFSSDKNATKFKYLFSKATLNQRVYNLVRGAIKEKLGDVSGFIADLEI